MTGAVSATETVTMGSSQQLDVAFEATCLI